MIFDYHRPVNDKDEKYLYHSLDVANPFAYFYIMANKVHNKPSWKVRPIVSVSRSITHGLRQWLDQQLKPIIQKLSLYIASSFQLKQQLEWLASKRLEFNSSSVMLCQSKLTLTLVMHYRRLYTSSCKLPHSVMTAQQSQ
jgi:hypothetical protein